MSEWGKGFWVGAFIGGLTIAIAISISAVVDANTSIHVNHPEGSEMHPVYLNGSKLYMDHKLFLRAVQCARTPDACQDVEQLDYPAETVLAAKEKE